MNTSQNPSTGSMLLSIQMIADPLDELFWDFTLETTADTSCLRCLQVYCGQTELQEDTLYLIPEGMGQNFPVDSHRYVALEDVAGKAPHIRNLRRPIYEVLNQIESIF